MWTGFHTTAGIHNPRIALKLLAEACGLDPQHASQLADDIMDVTNKRIGPGGLSPEESELMGSATSQPAGEPTGGGPLSKQQSCSNVQPGSLACI